MSGLVRPYVSGTPAQLAAFDGYGATTVATLLDVVCKEVAGARHGDAVRRASIVYFLNEHCLGLRLDFARMRKDRFVNMGGEYPNQWIAAWRGKDAVPKASDGSSGEPPAELCCPINLTLFEDPVMTCVKKTYERAAIEDWLREHDVDPMTNQPLFTKYVRIDFDMREKCEAFRAQA